jgi:hypothetical protein
MPLHPIVDCINRSNSAWACLPGVRRRHLLTLQSSHIVCIGSELHERVFAAHLTLEVGLFGSATPKHQHQHSNTKHQPSTTHKQNKRHPIEKITISNHHINKVANQTRCASSSPSLSSKAAAASGVAPWTNALMRQPPAASSQSAPWESARRSLG